MSDGDDVMTHKMHICIYSWTRIYYEYVTMIIAE